MLRRRHRSRHHGQGLLIRKDQFTVRRRTQGDGSAQRTVSELVGGLEQRIRILEVRRYGMLALHNHLEIHLIRRGDHPHRSRYVVAEAGQVVLVLVPLLPDHQLVHPLLVAASAGVAVVRQLLEGNRIHLDNGPSIQPSIRHKLVLTAHIASSCSLEYQGIQGRTQATARMLPGIHHLIAEGVRNWIPKPRVVEEVVVRPVVQGAATIAARFGVELDVQRGTGADKVHLFHGPREGVAEGLYNPRGIRVIRVVDRQGLAAVAFVLQYR